MEGSVILLVHTTANELAVALVYSAGKKCPGCVLWAVVRSLGPSAAMMLVHNCAYVPVGISGCMVVIGCIIPIVALRRRSCPRT